MILLHNNITSSTESQISVTTADSAIAGIHQTEYNRINHQFPVINDIITGNTQIANSATTYSRADIPKNTNVIKSLMILYFKLLRYNKYIYYANLL